MLQVLLVMAVMGLSEQADILKSLQQLKIKS
jgi:hypothetical protein